MRLHETQFEGDVFKIRLWSMNPNNYSEFNYTSYGLISMFPLMELWGSVIIWVMSLDHIHNFTNGFTFHCVN